MCTLLEPILSHILHDLKAAFAPGNHLLLVETLSSLGLWNTAFAWFFSSSDSSPGSFSFHPSLFILHRAAFYRAAELLFSSLFSLYTIFYGFPGGKELACQCRRCKRLRFDPWFGTIPEAGNGNLLQYSCLKNPMNRAAWRATIHRVKKSQT